MMCKIFAHKSAQTVVMIHAKNTVKTAAWKIYSLIFSNFSAPKNFATGTLNPAQIPIQKPSTRNCTLLDAPTLASAFVPSTLPTIAASIRLYVCCNRLPINSGTANCKINLNGLPSVILFVTIIHLFSQSNHLALSHQHYQCSANNTKQPKESLFR